MEAIDQGASTTSQVRDNVVAESGGPYSSHLPPLVQQTYFREIPRSILP